MTNKALPFILFSIGFGAIVYHCLTEYSRPLHVAPATISSLEGKKAPTIKLSDEAKFDLEVELQQGGYWPLLKSRKQRFYIDGYWDCRISQAPGPVETYCDRIG